MYQKSIYERIKRQNGEVFAQTLRDFDSGIFSIPGIVHILKYAGSSAEPIKELLASSKSSSVFDVAPSQENPFKLLQQAGYNAFVADTLKKQNSIQSYFADCGALVCRHAFLLAEACRRDFRF